MNFHIGDKVVHYTHGLGEIVRIEEKIIHDRPANCYVVRTPDMMIWIPINDLQQSSLRLPTPPGEFVKLFEILASPGEPLPEDRVQRKDWLLSRMRDGQLSSLFRVVRDLTSYKRKTKLNDQERTLFDRAVKSVLTEWTSSMGISESQAHQKMLDLLGE